MAETLLRTKLHVPPLRPDLVPRPSLIARLQEGWQAGHPLILISAPAGFGKTTLLCDWIRGASFAVSWLSLDAADDDPGRFFAYFIAALQEIHADLGQEIVDSLAAGQIPPAQVIAATLTNQILTLPKPFLLVLDDFHLIQDPFIMGVIEQLLANPLPPLRLALVTREDPPLPLARLRAGAALSEIRAGELRFSQQDTACFLNEMLALSLSEKDIQRLAQKTEGWVAGLQLAALSLREQKDPTAFISTLSGSQRLIMGYLTEQVLRQQTPEIRRFLLQTAVLNRLNGDLCDAVTGRSDGQAMLERLYQGNLFLIPLDEERKWYRYQRMFLDLLRDQQHLLPAQEMSACHRRASQWYARAGLPSQAIEHALKAEDYEQAVDLLERHAQEFLQQGHAKTVNGWLQRMPRAWRPKNLRTYLALAWAHLLRGAYDQALPFLEQLQSALQNPELAKNETDALRAGWLVLRSLLLFMQGQIAESGELASQALAAAPQEDERVRGLAYYTLGNVRREQGDIEQARLYLQQAAQFGRSAGDQVVELMSVLNLALIAFEGGQLHLAMAIISPLIMRLEESSSRPPISAVLYGIAGDIHYQWGHMDEARHFFQRSLTLSALGGYKSGLILTHVSLSRLALVTGDLAEAEQELKTAVTLMQEKIPPYVSQELAAQQVRLYLAQERLAAAAAVLQKVGFSLSDPVVWPLLAKEGSPMTYSLGLLLNSWLRVLLQMERNGSLSSGGSAKLLQQTIAAAEQSNQPLILLESLLLRVQMLQNGRLDQRAAAQANLLRALQLSEPQGLLAIFVEQEASIAQALAALAHEKQLEGHLQDHLGQILHAFSNKGAKSGQPSLQPGEWVEPLTERELQVLALMAEGQTYRQIAESLFISVNTVRYHVKALYEKLQANNRTQALQKARQSGIL